MNFGDLLADIDNSVYRDGSVTRFAPSPTGSLHIGGARNALLSYAMAKGVGGGKDGKFILRIEDTDRNRLASGSEEEIIAGIRYLDIMPDQIVRQSDSFGKYSATLMDRFMLRPYDSLYFDVNTAVHSTRPNVYWCPMTQEAISVVADRDNSDDDRAKFKKLVDDYVKAVAGLVRSGLINDEFVATDAESATRALIAGQRTGRYCRPWVANAYKGLAPQALASFMDPGGEHHFPIRVAVPVDGTSVWNGQNGEMSVLNCNAGYDAILIKRDGWPTYFWAAALDDYQSDVSVVIRGSEWLPSTAVYLAARDLAGPQPSQNFEIWHVPVILSPTGKGKLSKRHLVGSESNKIFISGLANSGYPAEAVRAWLLSSVVNIDNDRPYVSTDEVIEGISGKNISTHNQAINFGLLDRISHIVMSSMTPSEILRALRLQKSDNSRRVMQWLGGLDTQTVEAIIEFIGNRAKTFNDAETYLGFLDQPVTRYAAARDKEIAAIVKSNIGLVTPYNVEQLISIIVAETGREKRYVMSELRGIITAAPISLPTRLAVAALSRDQLSRNLELC